MGKETRDLLKKILSTQETILKHLKNGSETAGMKKSVQGKTSPKKTASSRKSKK